MAILNNADWVRRQIFPVGVSGEYGEYSSLTSSEEEGYFLSKAKGEVGPSLLSIKSRKFPGGRAIIESAW